MTDIRTLGPDETITEPGFYQMPLSRHHNQPCDGVSVTSGILRTMELSTPADVWAFHALNPRRFEKKETEALRLGVAMALFVEGGAKRLLEGFKVHPEDKPRRPTAGQIEAYDAGNPSEAGAKSVEYWRAVDAEPFDFLTVDELASIIEAGTVLAADPGAQAALGGIPEVTMAWQDELTGLWVLSRPDTVNFDGTVMDYKRISPGGKVFSHRLVDQRIVEHGYDMQLALAVESFERLTGERPGIAGIVAQMASAPYHVILRDILPEDIEIAAFRNRRALSRFAECLASGRWPGPGDDVAAFQRPDWQRDMLLQQINMETAA